MTVRVTTKDRTPIATFATATATTLLLYTVLATTGQQECLPISSGQGGREPMFTVNTARQANTEFIIDENVLDFIKFNRLAKEWKSERGAQSTMAVIAALPGYMKIIGMGKPAIPLILAQLKAEGNAPDHWFWALAVISEENPVPKESRGKLSEMAKAWLDWGKERDFA